MPSYGPICYDFDFDTDGKRVGALHLDHSDDDNAYSVIPIPIAVIKNGEGPTVLLAAGNHGNEYEGQVLLRELVRELEPDDIKGRVLVMPSMNMPAARADTRVSPLDAGNLNREFPGAADRGPTSAIAGFVTEVVLPLCDAGIDIHTGGSSATFSPLVFLCSCEDQAVFEASAELATAFDAPWTYLVTGIEDQGGMDPAAQTQGVAFISTELGGGARLGTESLRIGRRGVRNMLEHLGIAQFDKPAEPKSPQPRRFLTNALENSSLVSCAAGFLETLCHVGDEVQQGDRVAVVHPLDAAFDAPVEFLVPTAGIVVAQRTTARVEVGDIVLSLAREIDEPTLRRRSIA